MKRRACSPKIRVSSASVPLGEAWLGRRNFLELMSAFTTPLLLSARNGKTELGEVAPTTLTTQRDEPTILLLGSRSWRVTDVDWKRRLAWVEPSEEGGRSLWPGSSRFIPYASCDRSGRRGARVVCRAFQPGADSIRCTLR